MLKAILQNPLVISAAKGAGLGALTGWAAAARVDYLAFKAFKTPHDFLAYSWGIAIFRWAHGAAIGAIAGSGLGAFIG